MSTIRDRRIFPPELAKLLESRIGRPFRPSNGTEGELFMGCWCADCRRDGECRIPTQSMVFPLGDPQYPHQWQYGPDGQPRCTEHEENPNVGA